MKTYVVLNDIQLPWADTKVLDLVLDFVQATQPHGVVLNGDIVDMYDISDYDRNPLQRQGLQKEIRLARRLMERLEHVSERWWIGGNHEDRLRRYIWRHPEIADLDDLRFPALFHLAEHGFTWKPYGQGKLLGKLLVTHGFLVRTHSGVSAKAHFERLGTSVLHGHTHRLGTYYRTNVRGTHAAYENGCLCKLTPEYAQHPDWQHGFSVVHVDPSGWFSVQQIAVLNRRTFFYGKERYGD